MRTLSLIIIAFLVQMLYSCRSIDLSSRRGKDYSSNSTNISILNGIYINSPDSASDLYSAWQRLDNKTLSIPNDSYIQIKVLSERKLQATLLSQNKSIDEKILKGKNKKGYFVLRNRYKAKLNFGPFLWTFAGFKIYLGVTKENNLILLESNAGTTIVLILPVFPAGDRHFFEYRRKEK